MCGHSVEEHRDESRECEADDCMCVMYEADDGEEAADEEDPALPIG
jgi:hypothetical protein